MGENQVFPDWLDIDTGMLAEEISDIEVDLLHNCENTAACTRTNSSFWMHIQTSIKCGIAEPHPRSQPRNPAQ